MIKIDPVIHPVPPPSTAPYTRNGGTRKYPWQELQPGQSFTIPAGTIRPEYFSRHLTQQRRLRPNRRYTYRTLPDNSIRVWRTE